MDEVGLGKQLQAARKSAGLTQQELCHKAGLSYSTLAKIERGAIKAPSIFTIHNIAVALGLSLNSLLNLPDNPSQPGKKLSKSGVSFVYFDINGCLVRFFHRAFSAIALESGMPADMIETAFWRYNDDICRGEMSISSFNETMRGLLGMESFDWLRYYLDAIDPIEETAEMVRWASQNYRVGLLSNIMPGLIGTLLEKGVLPNIEYAAIVDSSEVGAIKPEPEIFKVAQEKAGVEPGEILFVDDSRTNIMAAQKLGWRVMWFNDYNPAESVQRVKDALQLEE